MATSVTLPALGESVTEGTVTRWLKQEGDTVEADEPLLEVSTDKVDTEIPSPAAGTLISITVHEDETVEVGAELAVIGDPDDADAGAGGDPAAGDESANGPSDGAAQGSGEGADEGADAAVATAGDAAEPQQAEPEQSEHHPEQTEAEPAAQEQQSSDSGGPTSSGETSSGGGTGGSGRSVSVTLPALGESVTEGTVTRWLKQEGDTVEADEPLLEVSTDKVDTEIPSPAAGTLISITVHEDETVEVGAELAVIGDPDDADAGAGDGGDDRGAEQGSAVEMDEQPAAVAEKAAAEQEPEKSTQTQPAQDKPAQDSPTQDEPRPAETRQSPSQPQDADAASSQTQEADDRQAPTKPPAGDGAYVTPLVRKLATERGVDLDSISGTGVGGRIRKQDVLEAADAAAQSQASAQSPPEAAEPSTAPAPSTGGAPAGGEATKQSSTDGAPTAQAGSLRGQTVKMPRMRQFIARRMVESLQVSAQLTTVVEVDVTQIARLRNRAKVDFQAREGVKLSFLPFFAKAANEALRAYPQLNASINAETNEVTYHGAEHLGVAVDTERGLIVPVIHDAGDLNIGGLARKIADLAERTRTNKISPDELSGGTFTLTNTGSRGALFDTPILNQPQVGILGTGAVVKRPVVVDDARLGETIAVRSMVYLALTYDHRLVDGADAARFLTAMKQRLEEGKFESDLGL